MLTAERLRDVLLYDLGTGEWTWLKSLSSRAKVGDKAGRKGGNGYWQIGIDGKRYPSARLAFLYVNGTWPKYHVDHIDCDTDNNRWLNLREATKSQNGANRGKPAHNSSGFKGVTWAKRERKWVAQIMVDYRHICLGYFDDPVVAHYAYLRGAQRHFGEFSKH